MISNLILTGWNWMRWLRLSAGLFILFQAYFSKDNFSAFLGSILLLQAITNTGCCGSSGCNISETKIKAEKEEPKFEIIKPK
ncbi:MAG TPA: hypothetical protein PLC27_03405 [Saprospiraceae bacterium]|mgnify:FL=1|jgi:hypothetical protein|nr:hypothetical protein [Saprospiraceae bacterium]MBK8826298.1 hypothetical protein [Saprospiraceae bacterium]MBK8888313.1 hypothetical protein [Saprospiraceae bacterium]HMT52548.1 hypothetical protein [Saprospiraceae bacterium]HMT69409.1 hypothetical protein [Saprospiraceae bacterium]